MIIVQKNYCGLAGAEEVGEVLVQEQQQVRLFVAVKEEVARRGDQQVWRGKGYDEKAMTRTNYGYEEWDGE